MLALPLGPSTSLLITRVTAGHRLVLPVRLQIVQVQVMDDDTVIVEELWRKSALELRAGLRLQRNQLVQRLHVRMEDAPDGAALKEARRKVAHCHALVPI